MALTGIHAITTVRGGWDMSPFFQHAGIFSYEFCTKQNLLSGVGFLNTASRLICVVGEKLLCSNAAQTHGCLYALKRRLAQVSSIQERSSSMGAFLEAQIKAEDRELLELLESGEWANNARRLLSIKCNEVVTARRLLAATLKFMTGETAERHRSCQRQSATTLYTFCLTRTRKIYRELESLRLPVRRMDIALILPMGRMTMFSPT